MPVPSSEYRRKQRILIRSIIINAKNVPCADCNQRYPTCVMELDHVRGVKRFEISEAKLPALRPLRDEIAKCDVVCANCHRLRTFNGNHHLRNRIPAPDPLADQPELF